LRSDFSNHFFSHAGVFVAATTAEEKKRKRWRRKRDFLQSTKMFVLFSVRVSKNKSSYVSDVTAVVQRVAKSRPPRNEKKIHRNENERKHENVEKKE
jgi:hypothetical protein